MGFCDGNPASMNPICAFLLAWHFSPTHIRVNFRFSERIRFSHKTHQGVSLVLTLVVLAGIVVLFAIMARLVIVEKKVTRSYSNLLRAELAAKAGASDAESLLLNLFLAYPDSATYWEPKIGDTSTPGTVYLYRNLAVNDKSIAYDGSGKANNLKIYARPLVSDASTEEAYPQDNFVKTLSTDDVKPDRSIDINEANSSNEEDNLSPWVGAMPSATPAPIRIPWVDIKDDKGTVVGRYAFWVDDESFKLNVNSAKAAARKDAQSEETPDEKPNPQASLRGVFLTNSSEPDTGVADAVEKARNDLAIVGKRFLSPQQVGHSASAPAGVEKEEFGPRYKYLLTTSSSGLDLTRSGARRLDLDEVVSRSDPGEDGTSDPIAIQRAVGQIAAAIDNQAPHFGQRFYRLSATNILTSTVTPSNAQAKNKLDVPSTGDSGESLYLKKLAANIRDYISKSKNPTVMDSDGNVVAGSPVYSLGDFGFDMSAYPANQPNPLPVIGKKALPYLTEYAVKATKIDSKSPSANPDGACDYKVQIDHYFEFWNPTTKTIRPADGDLGKHPYLVVENQPAISVNNLKSAGDQDVPAGRPFMIKLDGEFSGAGSQLEFPPGEVVIITTDPAPGSSVNAMGDFSGKRVYSAKALYAPGGSSRCDDGVSEPPYPTGEGSLNAPMKNVRLYKCTSFDKRGDGDYGEIQYGPEMERAVGTKLILGNDDGLLDANPGLAMYKITNKNMVVFKPDDPSPTDQVRGCFVQPTKPGLYDPRGSMEAINLELGTAASSGIQASYSAMMWTSGGSLVMNLGRLGGIAATDICDTDYVPTTYDGITLGKENAPMILRGGPMMSIGELGNIFDPIRPSASSLALVQKFRAGGRTLVIGKPDPVWDGTRSSALSDPELAWQVSRSRGWAAWRLCDIFTVRDDTRRLAGPGEAASTKATVEGLYNPNGILRDNGRVLRALVEGIEFPDDSDSALRGKKFNTLKTEAAPTPTANQQLSADAGGQALAAYLAQRLTRTFPTRFSPIWEPGELSQLYLFSRTSTQLVSGVTSSKVLDRGQEEVVRRLADLITPKGNTFSIYTVGQALDKKGQPVATRALRIIVRLHPRFDPPLEDDFDPADPGSVTARFAQPSGYTLEVLGTEGA